MLLNATGAENVLLLADYAAVKKVIFAPGAPNRKEHYHHPRLLMFLKEKLPAIRRALGDA